MRPHGCSFPKPCRPQACRLRHHLRDVVLCPAAYRIAYRQGRAMQWTARSEKVREDRSSEALPTGCSPMGLLSRDARRVAAGRGGADGKGYEKVPYGVRENSDPGLQERDKEDAARVCHERRGRLSLCWHRGTHPGKLCRRRPSE